MGTHYYSLPTVDPDSTLSFPDAVNGLANATDAVLHGVQTGFEGDPYTPPIAGPDQLGVVRIGAGFKVYSDGLLATEADPFVLKPSTDSKLGGIYAGKNVVIDDAGHISIGEGAFASKLVGTAELASGAVTNAKLATPAVTQDNLDGTVYNGLVLPEQMWKSSQVTAISDAERGSLTINFRKLTDKIAVVSFAPIDTNYFTSSVDANIGATVKMLVGGSEAAPGSLWSGNATIVANFYGTASGGEFVYKGKRAYILDFDNSTITQPADNEQLRGKGGFALYGSTMIIENQYAILVKE